MYSVLEFLHTDETVFKRKLTNASQTHLIVLKRPLVEGYYTTTKWPYWPYCGFSYGVIHSVAILLGTPVYYQVELSFCLLKCFSTSCHWLKKYTGSISQRFWSKLTKYPKLLKISRTSQMCLHDSEQAINTRGEKDKEDREGTNENTLT